MEPTLLFRELSLLLNDEARVLHCSDELLEVAGWTRDEVIGCDWFERFLPRPHGQVKEAFSQLLLDNPGVWTYENEIITRRGERKLILWQNGVLRSSSGRVVGTASVVLGVRSCAAVRPHPRQRNAALRTGMTPEAIIALADDLHVDPQRAGLALIRLIAEHCAQLAEECPSGASALDAAETIRLLFSLAPDDAPRH